MKPAIAYAPQTELLALARWSLEQAQLANWAAPKYVAAHQAAIQCAAALVCRVTRASGTGPISVWVLLARHFPEYAEWAEFFAAGAGKRAAAQAGLGGAVSDREADDLVRDAYDFLNTVSLRLEIHDSVPNNVIPLRR